MKKSTILALVVIIGWIAFCENGAVELYNARTVPIQSCDTKNATVANCGTYSPRPLWPILAILGPLFGVAIVSVFARLAS